MNELQEELLSECYRWNAAKPHITYGTQPDRFGLRVPPSPRHADCSGFTHSMFQHVGISIGYDTGDIARKTARGDFKSRYKAVPGDLMLHRQGSIYNGGPDEHVGIFVRYSGTRTYTWESAGSGKGVGYYSRASSWWTDAIRVPALFAVPDRPTIPEDDDMTDAEKKLLFASISELHDKTDWALAYLKKGGYPARSDGLPSRLEKIEKKLGA